MFATNLFGTNAELGQALAAHPGDTAAALAEYEQRLFPRRTAAAEDAAEGLALCLNDDAPRDLVRFFAARPA